MFRHIGILGLGLIGGSIAKTLRKNSYAGRITAIGRNPGRLEKACSMGLADDFCSDYKRGVDKMDLVILGTPVCTIVELARLVIPALSPGALLTDVGSVKEPIVKDIESHVPSGIYFIGGHPIAGTEMAGFESARDDLFYKKKCILTPTNTTDPTLLQRLIEFWSYLGANVITMDTDTHDRIFAAVSHLPHMVAFSLVNALVHAEGLGTKALQYSAGGFKDFTRIAASDPVMWRDIALLNKDNILEAIGCFEYALQTLKDAMCRKDSETIHALFETSRDARRSL